MSSASALVWYRDDGPLAQTVGVVARGRVSPLLLGVFGALLPYAALTGRIWLGAIGAAWCALVAGLGSHSRHGGRLDWLVPPILRATEYVFLAAVGIASGVPGPLIFGLICALAYHHYDTVYRLRQRVAQPRWLAQAGLGWEGRMIVVSVAALLDVATAVYLLLAVVLGALFVAESVLSWLRAQHRRVPDDTEGERPEQ